MSATVDPFELALDPPLQTARETMDTRRGMLFRVASDPPGIGESTPLLPFTESRSVSRRALERAAEAFETAGWREAFGVVSHTGNGRLRFPAARHAVSLSYLDHRGRKAGQPLYRFLGGDPVESIPVNVTLGDGRPEETARAAETARDEGFEAIKVKVGRGSLERDLARLRAVRERVGPGVELRADANGAWKLPQARSFLERVKPLDLSHIEQPLAPDSTEDHARLRGMGTPIALDESLGKFGVRELLEWGAADVFVLKPMALGGIDVARGSATRIRRAGAESVVTSIFEGVVGRTGAVHLAASLPGHPPAGLATASRFVSDLGPDPAPVRDGSISPPSEPGLGVREVGIDG
ncbi:MAG: mandelate racemase/muconate lactonizing enzyme family protein [Halodesulfurarchaeum sp.]